MSYVACCVCIVYKKMSDMSTIGLMLGGGGWGGKMRVPKSDAPQRRKRGEKKGLENLGMGKTKPTWKSRKRLNNQNPEKKGNKKPWARG